MKFADKLKEVQISPEENLQIINEDLKNETKKIVKSIEYECESAAKTGKNYCQFDIGGLNISYPIHNKYEFSYYISYFSNSFKFDEGFTEVIVKDFNYDDNYLIRVYVAWNEKGKEELNNLLNHKGEHSCLEVGCIGCLSIIVIIIILAIISSAI